MRAVRTGLNAAGIPVECSKGEASVGQEEINVSYADALAAADAHVITKNAVKEIAWSKGRAVTFMAKYDSRAAGSSCHIHQSLRRQDGTPAFFDPAEPHGMSATMRAYLAGLIAHAAETTCFLAPNVNSYKRFVAGTFAPTKTVWSTDNRTAGFRLVGADGPSVRVECRIGGADLNPYLACAAQIAAGIAGIEQDLTLGPEFRGDAYQGARLPEIPTTLRDATEALRRSKMLRAAFGDAVVDHYVHAARWEQAECDRRVTDWDLKRGFERA
jgi:glutamine synthetase